MADSTFRHESVLVEETCVLLQATAGNNYLDVTSGGGGHTEALLRRTSPNGKVLAIDADPAAATATQKRVEAYGDRVRVVQANFRTLADTVRQNPWIEPIAGVIADLGMSSFQLDSGKRGFSFRDTDVLDMRFDPGMGERAADLLMRISLEELASILAEYGEVTSARRVARSIIAMRDAARVAHVGHITVPMLVGAVVKSGAHAKKKIHPATQVFQALRMAVNDELGALRAMLVGALAVLPSSARIAVISFHSGEDRLVKDFFRHEARDCVCPPNIPQCVCRHRARLRILTKKPVTASRAEVERNPRARSATLRVAEKL